MDPQAGRDQWYLYDFFQGTLETDLNRHPSTERIERWMQQAGFSRTKHRIAARIRLSFRGRQVFDDSILQKKGTSQLTLLTDEAFQVGMDRIRAAVETDPGRIFTTDVSLYLTIGFIEG